jgi:excinuclease ABC subunit C
MMQEVFTRRFSEKNRTSKDLSFKTLPDLVIVDGGKGQLSSAVTALKKVGAFDKVQVIGIAKNLEEIFFPTDPIPIYLDKNSETLKLIQQLRDEAHRFGITHHRKKRSKNQLTSELDGIEGIGEKTKTTLLKEFKSVKRIREAKIEVLEKIVGKSKAHKIFVFLQTKNND